MSQVKVEEVELEEISSNKGAGSLDASRYLDVVKDVELQLSASLGEATINVGELFSLKSGEVLPLNKPSNEPIDILLNGKVVASGTLVVIGDSFGIQLTDITQL